MKNDGYPLDGKDRIDALDAVSYTHLDVYKRQVRSSAGRGVDGGGTLSPLSPAGTRAKSRGATHSPGGAGGETEPYSIQGEVRRISGVVQQDIAQTA